MATKLLLTCTRGGRAGVRSLMGVDTAQLTVGRGPMNDFVFDPAVDGQASTRHAAILRVGDGYVIRDLGATNGTLVDGAIVTGDAPLRSGAVIEFGRGGPLLSVVIVDEETELAGEESTVYVPGPPGPRRQPPVAQAPRRVPGAAPRPTRGSGLASSVPSEPEALAPVRPASARREPTRRDLPVPAPPTSPAARRRWSRALVGLTIVAALIATAWYWVVRADAPPEVTAETIARDNAQALFMLLADIPGHATGYCTAFVIDRSGLLATNAHCVRQAEEHDANGVRTLARMNGRPEQTFVVTHWKVHPDYRQRPLSTDVAIIQLDTGGGVLPTAVELADRETLGSLTSGQVIYTMGFPGQVMNEAQPAADFRSATVSRLTTYDNQPGDPASRRVVWHSALTSRGTSGSPIFDARGHVIAVNGGGASTRRVLVRDPATGGMVEEDSYEATGLNFGIRADAVLELLAPH